MWVDRTGHEEILDVPPREYTSLRLSPDGRRVALTATDVNSRLDDVWVWDTTRSALTRLTSNAAATDTAPVWTPDGRSLAFASDRDGAMQAFLQSADGAQEAVRLGGGEIPKVFVDSETLLVQESGSTVGTRLATIALSSGHRSSLLENQAVLANAAISANGAWLVYESNESGQFEIYVRPYPDLERRRSQVSTEGGIEPVWSRDGKELFFRQLDGQLMSVSVQTQGDFVAGEVRPLIPARYTFASGGNGRRYDVSPDGERFLMIKAGGGRIVLVQNWFEELKRLVPVD